MPKYTFANGKRVYLLAPEGAHVHICLRQMSLPAPAPAHIKNILFIYMYIYYLSINIKFRGQFHQSFCNGISIGV